MLKQNKSFESSYLKQLQQIKFDSMYPYVMQLDQFYKGSKQLSQESTESAVREIIAQLYDKQMEIFRFQTLISLSSKKPTQYKYQIVDLQKFQQMEEQVLLYDEQIKKDQLYLKQQQKLFSSLQIQHDMKQREIENLQHKIKGITNQMNTDHERAAQQASQLALEQKDAYDKLYQCTQNNKILEEKLSISIQNSENQLKAKETLIEKLQLQIHNLQLNIKENEETYTKNYLKQNNASQTQIQHLTQQTERYSHKFVNLNNELCSMKQENKKQEMQIQQFNQVSTNLHSQYQKKLQGVQKQLVQVEKQYFELQESIKFNKLNDQINDPTYAHFTKQELITQIKQLLETIKQKELDKNLLKIEISKSEELKNNYYNELSKLRSVNYIQKIQLDQTVDDRAFISDAKLSELKQIIQKQKNEIQCKDKEIQFVNSLINSPTGLSLAPQNMGQSSQQQSDKSGVILIAEQSNQQKFDLLQQQNIQKTQKLQQQNQKLHFVVENQPIQLYSINNTLQTIKRVQSQSGTRKQQQNSNKIKLIKKISFTSTVK